MSNSASSNNNPSEPSKPKSKLSHRSLVSHFHLNKPSLFKSLITPKSYLPYNHKLELIPEAMTHEMLQSLPSKSLSHPFPKWYLQVRPTYINHLTDYHNKHHTSIKSLFLSIDYLDHVMSSFGKNIITNNKYSAEVITIAVFLISKKYNEIDCEQIKMSNFTTFKGDYNSALNINVEVLKDYEVKCLKRLNYDLNKVTIYDFLMMFFNGRNVLTNPKDIINVRKNQQAHDCISLLKEVIGNRGDLIRKYSQPVIALGIMFIVGKIDEESISSGITRNSIINTIRMMYKYDSKKVLECMEMICDNKKDYEDESYVFREELDEDDKEETPRHEKNSSCLSYVKGLTSAKKTMCKPKLNFGISPTSSFSQVQTGRNRQEYEENTKYVSPVKKKSCHLVTFGNSMKKPKQSNGRIVMYTNTESNNNNKKKVRDYSDPPTVILPRIKLSNNDVKFKGVI